MIAALLFGVISSLHCIGMCGPIAVMLPVSQVNPRKKVIQILVYHLGRLSTYVLLGLVFGIFGKGLFLAGLQQQVTIVVGLLMIFYVVIPQNKWGKMNFLLPLYRPINKLKSALGKQFKKQSFGSLYTLGVFNGFLPCGMVYVALFGALATQNVITAGIYMALFGMGTIPLMSMMVYARNFVSDGFRMKMMQFYPYVILFFGIVFVIRGLGLDLPLLSPDTLSLFVQPEANC